MADTQNQRHKWRGENTCVIGLANWKSCGIHTQRRNLLASWHGWKCSQRQYGNQFGWEDHTYIKYQKMRRNKRKDRFWYYRDSKVTNMWIGTFPPKPKPCHVKEEGNQDYPPGKPSWGSAESQKKRMGSTVNTGPTKLNLYAIVPVDRVEKSHFLPGVFNTYKSISKPTPKPIHIHAANSHSLMASKTYPLYRPPPPPPPPPPYRPPPPPPPPPP